VTFDRAKISRQSLLPTRTWSDVLISENVHLSERVTLFSVIVGTNASIVKKHLVTVGEQCDLRVPTATAAKESDAESDDGQFGRDTRSS